MHCYNCGKEIDKHKDDAISLDDLNWSHVKCLHNPPHLMEDSELVIDPFDTYEPNELPLNDLSKCGEACNCVNCHTKAKQAVIDDVTLLHRKLLAIQTLDAPKYMFKDKEVSPHTWIDIQNMQLDCYELGNHVALLVDPVTREYLYVFWDEAAQCSNPYPSYSDALAACKRYIELL